MKSIDMNEKQKKAFNVYENVGLLLAFAVDFSDLKSIKKMYKKFGEEFLNFFKMENSPELKKVDSGIRKEMKTAIESMLKETKTEFNEEETKELNKMFDDKTCDELIKIVGKYKFDLPPLTEELKAGDLVEYFYLALKRDSNYGGLIQELLETKIIKENVKISAGFEFKIEYGKKTDSGFDKIEPGKERDKEGECSNCGGLISREFRHEKIREGLCWVITPDGGRGQHSR